jgi:hypothetical protein
VTLGWQRRRQALVAWRVDEWRITIRTPARLYGPTVDARLDAEKMDAGPCRVAARRSHSREWRPLAALALPSSAGIPMTSRPQGWAEEGELASVEAALSPRHEVALRVLQLPDATCRKVPADTVDNETTRMSRSPRGTDGARDYDRNQHCKLASRPSMAFVRPDRRKRDLMWLVELLLRP